MGKDIKVSIIIPAYNVEKYIGKCLNTILNQTYTNLEVIVVNDGSTDGTKEVLENIDDNRLVILNKQNEGVSAARNTGLAKSNGQYVIFVDGDDYIAEDYVEYMMNLVNSTGAEFCLSQNCFTKQGEKQINQDCIQILSPEDATALLLSPKVIVGCWNKIYSKHFIEKNNLRFSQNLFYGEGLSFITTCSQLATKIGMGNRKVYYYRRNNEASATSKFDICKYINGEKALKEIRNKMTIANSKIDNMYNLHMGLFCLGATVKIKANHKDKEYVKEYKHWRKGTKFYTKKILLLSDVSIYRKLMLLGGCFSPWILMKLDRMRRKNISKKSVSE